MPVIPLNLAIKHQLSIFANFLLFLHKAKVADTWNNIELGWKAYLQFKNLFILHFCVRKFLHFFLCLRVLVWPHYSEYCSGRYPWIDIQTSIIANWEAEKKIFAKEHGHGFAEALLIVERTLIEVLRERSINHSIGLFVTSAWFCRQFDPLVPGSWRGRPWQSDIARAWSTYPRYSQRPKALLACLFILCRKFISGIYSLYTYLHSTFWVNFRG